MKWFRLLVAAYGALVSIGFAWWVSVGAQRQREIGFIRPALIVTGFAFIMFAYLLASHSRGNNANRS